MTGVGRADRWMPGAMLVGYGSHLLGDLVTVEGVALLWPLSGGRQRVALIGATDHRREHLVCLGAGALGAYLAVTLIAVPALAAVARWCASPDRRGAEVRCPYAPLRDVE